MQLWSSFLPVLSVLLTQVRLTPAASVAIHASVVFTRNGERTPIVDEWQEIVQLTTTGAQQLYAAGYFFQQRYLTPAENDQSTPSTALNGLQYPTINPQDLYILAPDSQFISASAQAFIQGLYPPVLNDATLALQVDPSSVLANGSYIGGPLGGYQYPWIHTASENDPEVLYVNGEGNCPSWDAFATAYYSTLSFNHSLDIWEELYMNVSQAVAGSDLPPEAFQFGNAYEVYDYLSYMVNHNNTYAESLTSPSLANGDALDVLRYLADQAEFAQYGDLSTNDTGNDNQISTIAGQTLAAKVTGLLNETIETQGGSNKLSLLFGEYPAFLSFFALARLPSVSINFTGIPDWGSSMVFELFSYVNGTSPPSEDAPFPPDSELLVRFLFRNGTSDLEVYPLFAPSMNSMPWSDFQDAMSQAAVFDVGEWCALCDAWLSATFCPAWNISAYQGVGGGGGGGDVGVVPVSVDASGMTTRTAGVIGAAAALALQGLILVIAVGCCGLRFRRVSVKGRPRTQGPSGAAGVSGGTVGGGFKGGLKLASDVDLTSGQGPKGAAGITIEEQKDGAGFASGSTGPRVGSWELKETQSPRADPTTAGVDERAGRGLDAEWRSSLDSRPHSFLGSEDGGYVGSYANPVRPDERV